MTIQEIQSIYQENADRYSTLAIQLQKKYNQLAIVRLITFFMGIGLAFLIADLGIIFCMAFIIAFIIGFGKFMIWHQNIGKQREHYKILQQVNENELKYLALNYNEFENGEEFMDPAHPNSVDMDIFGSFSLFQYINRTSTSIGKKRLSEYLTQPANFEEIQKRQESIKELSPKLEWRQDFQSHSFQTEDSQREISALVRWLEKEDYVILNNGFLKILLWVFPALVFGAIVGIYFGLSYKIAVGLGIGQLLVIRHYLMQINEIHAQTAQANKYLKKYAQIIAHIEKDHFETPKLKQLRERFISDSGTASEAFRELSYIISQLNVRYNIFAVVLSGTVLWDLQWIRRLEVWKSKSKSALPEWFEALQEFEAMNAISTLHYNHPDWIFPTIQPENPSFKGVQLGHPLIDRNKRVANNIELPHKGHIKLITGSNMAGKSTFLRTVGLNIILAMMGAPVCAKRFELPLLEVYSSMRTQDALHESTSSFYAELKRLKVIIDAVDSKNNVFFLLDEILKGTNSNDRHKGAKALILQLIKTQGMGLVATHDLELGGLEAEYKEVIENLCMEVEVLEKELIFDYTIKKGVSQSFNATFLMRNMGIDV